MSNYKCNSSFKSSTGKEFSIGQNGSSFDFNSLPTVEQHHFSKNEEDDCKRNEPPITIMSDGHLGLNIGGGMSLDTSDGSLGVNVGGFSINI